MRAKKPLFVMGGPHSGMDFAPINQDFPEVMRPGKTAKERANGVWAGHLQNREIRRAENKAKANK